MNHSELTPSTSLDELQKVRLGWIKDNIPYARDLARAVVKLGEPVELDKFSRITYAEIESGGYTFLARNYAVDWNLSEREWNMCLAIFVLPQQYGELWRQTDNLLVNMVFTNDLLDNTTDRVFIPGKWQGAAETIFAQLQDYEKTELEITQETERQRLLKQLQVGKNI